MDDPFDLQRFVDAQDPVFATACAELRNGRKRTHWIWFIFPQIAGLGASQMSRAFAIASRDEAAAYLRHPVLGARLEDCTRLALRADVPSANALFGTPDDLKFHASMTLFAEATPPDSIFRDALQKYFGGEPHRQTMERLVRDS